MKQFFTLLTITALAATVCDAQTISPAQKVIPASTQCQLPAALNENAASPLAAARAESDGALFYENFSGWDKETFDWLPEGWTEQNSEQIKDIKDGAFTWRVLSPDGTTLPNPIDGDFYAAIYHASYKDENGTKVELPQDEWLITPAFTPRTDDHLSFYLGYNPLYLFNCSNENLDLSGKEIKFKNKIPATTMKILVREQGGEWKELHDVYDDWKEGYDFQELYDNFGASFHFYQFSMADYVGKNVQVAFRFVGYLGNTMELDAVKVSKPKAEAAYTRPAGTFNFGIAQGFNTYAKDMSPVLVPAFTDVQWVNQSSETATSFTWEYPSTNDATVMLKSNDRDLTVNYPAYYTVDGNMYDVPTLYAYSTPEIFDTFKSSATVLYAGGKASFTSGNYGACNYDLANGIGTYTDNNGTYLFGCTPGTNAVWKVLFGNRYDITVKGIGNSFDKPAAPYVLNGVNVHAAGEINADAQLTLTLYQMSAMGQPVTSKAIATATCTGADIAKSTVDGDTYLYIPFTFKNDQGEPEAVVIDNAMIAVLSGFNSDNSNFAVMQTLETDKYGESHGFAFFDFCYNGQVYIADYPYSFTTIYGGEYNGSFLFNLDAEWPWIQCDEDTFTANANGATALFNLNSYYDASKCNVTISEGGAEWLSYDLTDRDLVLTAQPSNGETRTCTVTVSAPACSKTFTVTQSNTTAIDAITTADGNLTVTVNDGIITVSNHGGAVTGKLYTVTGMTAMEFDVNGTIDASSLAPGIYVMVLDNGKTAKIVK